MAMASLLQTVLALTGIFACTLLILPVLGDCPKCSKIVKILSKATQNKLCSTQSARKTCYNNWSAACKATASGVTYKNRLDAVDYICQPSVLSITGRQLTNCSKPKIAKIKKNYHACWKTIKHGRGLRGSCRANAKRKCIMDSVYACCPSFCPYHDAYIYLYSRPSSISSDCLWELDQGWCRSTAYTC